MGLDEDFTEAIKKQAMELQCNDDTNAIKSSTHDICWTILRDYVPRTKMYLNIFSKKPKEGYVEVLINDKLIEFKWKRDTSTSEYVSCCCPAIQFDKKDIFDLRFYFRGTKKGLDAREEVIETAISHIHALMKHFGINHNEIIRRL